MTWFSGAAHGYLVGCSMYKRQRGASRLGNSFVSRERWQPGSSQGQDVFKSCSEELLKVQGRHDNDRRSRDQPGSINRLSWGGNID